MAIEIFRRKEQKYLITKEQYKNLINLISPYMRPDKFGQNGKYTVTSLYFESNDHKIYFETKNKLKYRQKLRLRVYNDTDITGTAFFEIKQKHKKVVNKRRMLLSLQEAYRYIEMKEDCLDNYETSNKQVLREIDYFRNLYQLKPEMIVSYGRHALHGITDADLRITFDFNLRCRNNDLSLENGTYGSHFIDQNLIVLEVKVNDSVPLWLTRILQELDCEQRSASKFCTSLEVLKDHTITNNSVKENVLIGGNI
ncbi:polyphosphate polymerase domain-containing protein [Oceanobacillus longus]|uniref:Polyphosphate polymerase domain-containing protein n=1 Tax=Oceanobacillus longus TaxID=930120 RepID=A0ABV8GY58_9BACI